MSLSFLMSGDSKSSATWLFKRSTSPPMMDDSVVNDLLIVPPTEAADKFPLLSSSPADETSVDEIISLFYATEPAAPTSSKKIANDAPENPESVESGFHHSSRKRSSGLDIGEASDEGDFSRKQGRIMVSSYGSPLKGPAQEAVNSIESGKTLPSAAQGDAACAVKSPHATAKSSHAGENERRAGRELLADPREHKVVREVLTFPAGIAGLVIGRNGATVKNIRAAVGARMRVDAQSFQVSQPIS
jgi:hypothetical protein